MGYEGFALPLMQNQLRRDENAGIYVPRYPDMNALRLEIVQLSA